MSEAKQLPEHIYAFLVAMEEYLRRRQSYWMQQKLDNHSDEGEQLLAKQRLESKARQGVGVAARILAKCLEENGHNSTNVLKVTHYVDEGGGAIGNDPALWPTTKVELQRLLIIGREEIGDSTPPGNIPIEYRAGEDPDGEPLGTRFIDEVFRIEKSIVARNLDDRIKDPSRKNAYLYSWKAVASYLDSKNKNADALLNQWQRSLG